MRPGDGRELLPAHLRAAVEKKPCCASCAHAGGTCGGSSSSMGELSVLEVLNPFASLVGREVKNATDLAVSKVNAAASGAGVSAGAKIAQELGPYLPWLAGALVLGPIAAAGVFWLLSRHAQRGR
jgi:hypothetical protein